jgi:ParB family chromosome partitioning protein
MGERRWRAAQEAGLTTLPAIVRETADDSMLRDALLENIHRAQLNPLEEAAAYQQLLDEFSVTHEELAARIVAEGLSVRATEEAVTLANREQDPTPSSPRRKPIQMPGLQDVAEKLSSAFDTRVTVSLGKRKGKIVVEFGSVDDLQRIVDLMDAAKA